MKISNPGPCTCQESPRLLSYILAIRGQGKNLLFSSVWPWIHCLAQTALKLKVLLLLSPAVHTCHRTKDFWFGLALCSCIFMCMVFCLHICVPHTCVVMPKVQKRASDPQGPKSHCWWLRATVWLLGTKPGSSESAASTERSFVWWYTVASSLSETVRSVRLAIPDSPMSSLTGREVPATSFHSLIFSVSFQISVYMFPSSKEKQGEPLIQCACLPTAISKRMWWVIFNVFLTIKKCDCTITKLLAFLRVSSEESWPKRYRPQAATHSPLLHLLLRETLINTSLVLSLMVMKMGTIPRWS